MRQFIQSWKDSIKYLSDPAASEGIVFYSEGDAYAPFLQPLINALGDVYDGPVYYLTSDATDRVLIDAPLNIRGFYISDGSARIYTLNHMHAAVVAMTTPDINTFHIKRSLKAQHYAYIHHSPVSTHMIYRKGAMIISIRSSAWVPIRWKRSVRGRTYRDFQQSNCSSMGTRFLTR